MVPHTPLIHEKICSTSSKAKVSDSVIHYIGDKYVVQYHNQCFVQLLRLLHVGLFLFGNNTIVYRKVRKA